MTHTAPALLAAGEAGAVFFLQPLQHMREQDGENQQEENQSPALPAGSPHPGQTDA